MNPLTDKELEQEVNFNDEVVYKSSPFMDPLVTSRNPPPLTRTLNIELQTLGELNFALDTSEVTNRDNIVEC